MSRIGKRILTIPAGTSATLNPENGIDITGPKGTLKLAVHPSISVTIENNTIATNRPNDIKKHRQLHGTMNSLINGMLLGVSQGFSKELEIVGVGYRAAIAGSKLTLNLGYSKPVVYEVPAGITVTTPKPTSVIISGIDKQLVGLVAAIIRDFRSPEPYKGKGIKYKDEKIRRKEGKSAGKGK